MSLKVEPHIWDALSFVASGGPFRILGELNYNNDDSGDNTTRLLAGTENAEGCDDDGHGGFGVHITFQDLYASVLFFTVIYVMGAFAQRVLKMPSLVGEIFAGILLGPPVADWVPNAEAFVMLGEIG